MVSSEVEGVPVRQLTLGWHTSFYADLVTLVQILRDDHSGRSAVQHGIGSDILGPSNCVVLHGIELCIPSYPGVMDTSSP